MNINVKYSKAIDQLKSNLIEGCEIEWNGEYFIINNKKVTVISDIDSIPKRLILYYYSRKLWAEIIAEFISASSDEISYECSISEQGKEE